MNVEDMIADIDDHGFEDSDEDTKLRVLNDVYQSVLGREAWPFLEKMDLAADVAFDTETGAVEASERVRAVLSFRYNNRTVRSIRLDDFLEGYGNRTTETGSPWLFYFIANELRVWPIPSSTPAGTILVYVRGAEDLDANTDEDDILIPREYHRDILVNGALSKLYALEDDAELAQGFKSYFEEGVSRMREVAWKRQYQDMEIVERPSFGW